jgi:hypothetical protein
MSFITLPGIPFGTDIPDGNPIWPLCKFAQKKLVVPTWRRAAGAASAAVSEDSLTAPSPNSDFKNRRRPISSPLLSFANSTISLVSRVNYDLARVLHCPFDTFTTSLRCYPTIGMAEKV